MKETTERLEEHKRDIENAAVEAKRLTSEAQAKDRHVQAQMLRYQQGLPSPQACPDCWMDRGEISIMRTATADDPAQFDRFACGRCGYFFDRRSH